MKTNRSFSLVNRACLIVIAILAVSIASSALASGPSKGQKLAGGVSVNVRTNKHGKKVDLSHAPGYKEAIVAFNSNNYADALKKFETLDSTGFCCDMVHYYIARCLQGQNQLAQAEMHYQWVSAYTKDPTLRSYSNYALQTLAYYGNHRTYAGNGNNFSRLNLSGGFRGGGGGFG